jgi:hypothetical protein
MSNEVNVVTLAKGTKIQFQYNGELRVGTVEKEGFSAKTGNHLITLATDNGFRAFKQNKMFEVVVL